MQKVNVKIEGMTCQHCVKHVTEALQEIPGVDTVDVNLEEKRALVASQEEIARAAIDGAVKEAGYEVVDVAAA